MQIIFNAEGKEPLLQDYRPLTKDDLLPMGGGATAILCHGSHVLHLPTGQERHLLQARRGQHHPVFRFFQSSNGTTGTNIFFDLL